MKICLILIEFALLLCVSLTVEWVWITSKYNQNLVSPLCFLCKIFTIMTTIIYTLHHYYYALVEQCIYMQDVVWNNFVSKALEIQINLYLKPFSFHLIPNSIIIIVIGFVVYIGLLLVVVLLCYDSSVSLVYVVFYSVVVITL